MTDPWISVLKALEPEYERLSDMADKGPHTSPELWKNSKGKWSVTLQEVWGDEVWTNEGPFGGEILDKTVEWAEQELKKWDCNRTAYDTWMFRKKQDAEKFITLFLIQWPK